MTRPTKCSQCANPHRSKGLCEMHYRREYRKVHPDAKPDPNRRKYQRAPQPTQLHVLNSAAEKERRAYTNGLWEFVKKELGL